MEIAGAVLFFGIGGPVLALLLAICVWLARRRIDARLWNGLLLLAGAAVGLFSALMPYFQLFHRMGPAYWPQCWAREECRPEILFCASWLLTVLLLIALQIGVFVASKKPQA
jgi:hypothetical protein